MISAKWVEAHPPRPVRPHRDRRGGTVAVYIAVNRAGARGVHKALRSARAVTDLGIPAVPMNGCYMFSET